MDNVTSLISSASGLISALSVVISIVWAVGKIRANTLVLESVVKNLEKWIGEVHSTVKEHAERITSVETKIGSIDSSVSKIDKRTEEMLSGGKRK